MVIIIVISLSLFPFLKILLSPPLIHIRFLGPSWNTPRTHLSWALTVSILSARNTFPTDSGWPAPSLSPYVHPKAIFSELKVPECVQCFCFSSTTYRRALASNMLKNLCLHLMHLMPSERGLCFCSVVSSVLGSVSQQTRPPF